MVKRDKRTIILDAAEQLFGERGYDAVSVRDVASRSKVGLGVITYYFATKELLLRQVLERRADELNSLRLQSLAAIETLTPEAFVRAFSEPLLNLILHGDGGWRAYSAVIAKAHQSQNLSLILASYFNETSDRFVEVLGDLAPQLPYQARMRGFMMTGMLMFGLLSYRRLDSMSHGVLRSEDIVEAHESMVSFATGGLCALIAEYGDASLGAESEAGPARKASVRSSARKSGYRRNGVRSPRRHHAKNATT
jgi:AcrR family transcriptional regulator